VGFTSPRVVKPGAAIGACISFLLLPAPVRSLNPQQPLSLDGESWVDASNAADTIETLS
jgi:hypothetical protein